MQTAALRAIRSDGMKSLARQALAQGFGLEWNGSGHPVLVSPDGTRVGFSATKRNNYHAVANVKSALVRAGFDPSATTARARRAMASAARGSGSSMPSPDPITSAVERVMLDEPRLEVPPMTDATVDAPVDAPETVKHKQYRPAGGKYVYTSAETLDLDGTPFYVRHRTDGQVAGFLHDDRVKSGRKVFARKDGDQSAIVEAARAYIAEGRPEPRRVGAETAASPAKTGHDAAEAPALAVDTAKRPNGASGGSRGVWAAAYVDPDDYPVAAGLDELDRMVAPAIEALLAAGKADAAELVRAELKRSPAEEELLRLYQEVMNRPRLEHPG